MYHFNQGRQLVEKRQGKGKRVQASRGGELWFGTGESPGGQGLF